MLLSFSFFVRTEKQAVDSSSGWFSSDRQSGYLLCLRLLMANNQFSQEAQDVQISNVDNQMVFRYLDGSVCICNDQSGRSIWGYLMKIDIETANMIVGTAIAILVIFGFYSIIMVTHYLVSLI